MSLSIFRVMLFAESDMLFTVSVAAHSVESIIAIVLSCATGVAGVPSSEMTEANFAVKVVIC